MLNIISNWTSCRSSWASSTQQSGWRACTTAPSLVCWSSAAQIHASHLSPPWWYRCQEVRCAGACSLGTKKVLGIAWTERIRGELNLYTYFLFLTCNGVELCKTLGGGIVVRLRDLNYWRDNTSINVPSPSKWYGQQNACLLSLFPSMLMPCQRGSYCANLLCHPGTLLPKKSGRRHWGACSRFSCRQDETGPPWTTLKWSESLPRTPVWLVGFCRKSHGNFAEFR